jgi:nitric oxide reductase activation protein
MSPKFAEEKNISPIPAPFIATGTNDNSKDNSNIKLYKVESDISVFNCAKVDEGSKNAEPTNIKSNPNDSDDLLELERRLAELSKSNTENTNPKEYSL